MKQKACKLSIQVGLTLTALVVAVLSALWTGLQAAQGAGSTRPFAQQSGGDEGEGGFINVPGIGDTVWNDIDGQGDQDELNAGIAGIRVYIDADGNGTYDPGEANAVTDAAGSYFIDGLAPITHTVRIDAATVPAGLTLTTANVPLIINLDPDENDFTADFGFQGSASLGDIVWDDLDGDGAQDDGATGLPGVRVYLDQNNNAAYEMGEAYALTDAAGAYTITGLAAATYTLRVDEATLPANYGDTTPNPLGIALADGEIYVNADFGFQLQAASIGDFVWNDLDGDGLQDAGEGGLANVGVFIDLNGNGAYDAGLEEPYATSDANGAYSLADLVAGNYTVQVDAPSLPAGYSLTSGNLPLNVNLATAESYTQADFGYRAAALDVSKTSSAGGSVNPGDVITYTIVIRNNSAAYQSGLALYDPLPPGTTYVPSSTLVTAPFNGYYADYFGAVSYSNSNGPIFWPTSWIEVGDDGSPNPVGNDIDIVSNQNSGRLHMQDDDNSIYRTIDLAIYDNVQLTFQRRAVSLESGEAFYLDVYDGTTWYLAVLTWSGPRYDLWYYNHSVDLTPYKSSNTRLRFRSPAGGMADGDDIYFDNIVITPSGWETYPGGAPSDLITAGDGYDLYPGEYMTVTFQVVVDDPVAAGIGSIDNTVTLTSFEQPDPLQASTSDLLPPADLGDRVWHDDNGDGLQDPGEPGLGGVVVSLYEDSDSDGLPEPGGDDGASLLSATTDANGYFQFNAILALRYFLVFEQPLGYAFAPADMGGDDALDSDAGAGGATPVLALTSGETNPNFDAGLITNLDYGDLPAIYENTLLSANGARHALGTLRLGGSIDTDTNGQESTAANGDDSDGSNDDDGVTRSGDWWTNGATIIIWVDLQGSTPSGYADLGIWIDWDNNGIFELTDFETCTGRLVGQVNPCSINVPGSGAYTVGDPVFVRVRLFDPDNLPGGGLEASDYLGAAQDGEVEDYWWQFKPTAVTLGDARAGSGRGNFLLPVAGLLIGLATLAWLVARKADSAS